MTGTSSRRPASFGPRRVARIDAGEAFPSLREAPAAAGAGAMELHDACGFAGKAVAGSQWRYVDADGAEGIPARAAHDAFLYHLTHGPAVKPVVMV